MTTYWPATSSACSQHSTETCETCEDSKVLKAFIYTDGSKVKFSSTNH